MSSLTRYSNAVVALLVAGILQLPVTQDSIGRVQAADVEIQSGSTGAETSVTFEKHVRPILKTHCFHCHGESGVSEGSLDLRLQRFITKGGDSGAAVVAGSSDTSLIIERIESGEMPPEGEGLSEEQLSVLARWIDQGAKTARPEPETLLSGEYFTEEERSFWSFQPVQRTSPYDASLLRSESPRRGAIDSFISKRLETIGLEFSPRADRRTLIRRATFDLWGLPPSPRMVSEFLKDDRPDAYARLIERLLSAPAYGERWGRHWLDVAGYADSEGYAEEDKRREFAYFYRDYVIDSFNKNKPLDQFVCEQIAGDEMAILEGESDELTPRRKELLSATGFLRLAPDGTGTGGVDRSVAANQNVADTIKIVSTALLGLTVGCAQCHDHRYDPISQADYYRFRALFEPALDWKAWKTPAQRRVSLYTSEQRKIRAEIEKQAKAQQDARRKRQQEHIDRTLEEELLVVPDEVRDRLRIAYKTAKDKRTAEQTAVLEDHPNVGNLTTGSLYLYAQQRARRANDITKAAEKKLAKYLAAARDANPNVEVTEQSLEGLLPDAFREIQRYRQAAKTCKEINAQKDLADMQAEYTRIRSTAPKENFLRCVNEPANHQPKTFLFIRGDHNQPGEQMQPAELTVLRQADREIQSDDPRLPTTGRRLAYARTLTSGDHPLLARVLVNRVWMHHFGRGIVATPGDFGILGAKPTHPQLLDWLATELIDCGWDLKRMHRMIMLSETYQQSSSRTARHDELDPDNLWYARASVRRLESESIRDSMLSVSGRILNQLHGPPVPVREDAVGQIVLGEEMLDGERKPTGKQSDFPGQSRRSLYVEMRRSRPLSLLQPFDLPDMSPNCDLRRASNVATQTLLMMNNDFVIKQSRLMADSLIRAERTTEARLALGWLRCFSKPVDAHVLVELSEFVENQRGEFLSRQPKPDIEKACRDALASALQAMLSSNEFIYID